MKMKMKCISYSLFCSQNLKSKWRFFGFCLLDDNLFCVPIMILELCVCVVSVSNSFFLLTSMYIHMYYVRLSISLTVWVIVCVREKQIKNASFEYISSRTFWVWHNLYTLYTHRWIQLPQSRSTIQARILILLNTNLYTMLYVGHCLMGIILAGSRRGAGASIVR